MKQFKGFPARTAFTAIPNPFFSEVLPEINDLAELKTMLHVMAVCYRKRGYPQMVTFRELLGDISLMRELGGQAVPPEDRLREYLQKGVQRGVLLHLAQEHDGASEDFYLLNSEAGRRAADKMEHGEIKPGGGGRVVLPRLEDGERPDIFALYEENIGMLTPMIAEELRAAEQNYPEDWLRDAIREAVNQNKRKWSYISAILEHWAAEGRSDGPNQRDTKKDPDKYLRGKYGHMVQR
ncbi:MAG: DnaD domain protein [Chloroflexota bacterium]